MVHLRVQSMIFLKLHKNVTNSSVKCKWDVMWKTLENAFKNGLKGANGCKISPVKKWK